MVVTVYVRHSSDCNHKSDAGSGRSGCPPRFRRGADSDGKRGARDCAARAELASLAFPRPVQGPDQFGLSPSSSEPYEWRFPRALKSPQNDKLLPTLVNSQNRG
jgi:hypothetical protein